MRMDVPMPCLVAALAAALAGCPAPTGHARTPIASRATTTPSPGATDAASRFGTCDPAFPQIDEEACALDGERCPSGPPTCVGNASTARICSCESMVWRCRQITCTPAGDASATGCPGGVTEGAACAVSGLIAQCPGTFAGCDGGTETGYCACTAGIWTCAHRACVTDAGNDEAHEAAVAPDDAHDGAVDASAPLDATGATDVIDAADATDATDDGADR